MILKKNEWGQVILWSRNVCTLQSKCNGVALLKRWQHTTRAIKFITWRRICAPVPGMYDFYLSCFKGKWHIIRATGNKLICVWVGVDFSRISPLVSCSGVIYQLKVCDVLVSFGFAVRRRCKFYRYIFVSQVFIYLERISEPKYISSINM